MTSVAPPIAEESAEKPTAAPQTWVTVAWGLLVGLFCVYGFCIAIETAYHFLGPAIDGPFQLYNALRRIGIGQRGGVDFQFFHGLGIPYLHYIPYRLLGGTFVASELTRELVSAILYPVSVVLFLKFFVRDWTRTLAWSAIVLAMSYILRLASVIVAVNSLLGVRSTLPVFVPVVLCLPIRRQVRTVLLGVTIGLALLFGSEQGLATIAALGIATIVMAIRSTARKEYVVDSAAAIAIGVVTLMVCLTMIGGVSGMRSALVYNFKIVPLDQYWYFGSPPNVFLATWGTIPKTMMLIPRMPVTLLVGVCAAVVYVALLWRNANSENARERFALAAFVLYGLISCASLLGSWANAYLQPLMRTLLLVFAVGVDRKLAGAEIARGRRLLLGIGVLPSLIGAATLAYLFVIVPGAALTVTTTIPHVLGDHVFGTVGPGFSGMWPETLKSGQAIINARRDSAGRPPTLWSTYAGLLEARNAIFHPTLDYVIHALGPANRAKYVDDFRRTSPRLVQTVRPSYTAYEEWIEDTSWDFYVELLRHYELAGTTPWSFFWERSSETAPPPSPVWSSDVKPGASGIQMPVVPVSGDGSGLMLLQVEIDYKIRNPLHVLPVVGGIPRYFVTATESVQGIPVTIDPYTTVARFPLLAMRGKAPVLRWYAQSLLPGARIEVSAVRLSVVQTSGKNQPWLAELVKADLATAEQAAGR